ncbi:MAG: DnaJ domain-containing protein, partial [Planctomycetota bacterium]
MDPYKVLRVSPDASEDEIRKAYRKMAAKYHPDIGGEAWIFQQVQDAYKMITEGETDAGTGSAPPPSQPQPAPQPNPQPQRQPQPQRPRRRSSGSQDTGYSAGSGSFAEGFSGARPQGRRVPQTTSARVTTKKSRLATARSRKSRDETIKMAVIGLSVLLGLVILAVGGMYFFNQVKDSGLADNLNLTGAIDDSGDVDSASVETEDDNSSAGDTNGSSGSGLDSLADFTPFGGSDTQESSSFTDISSTRPSDSNSTNRPDSQANTRPPAGYDSDIADNSNREDTKDEALEGSSRGSSAIRGNRDDDPLPKDDLLASSTEDEEDEDEKPPIAPDAPSKLTDLQLRKSDRPAKDPKLTPNGHAITRAVIHCDDYIYIKRRTFNIGQAQRKIYSAINQEADLFGFDVFLVDDMVKVGPEGVSPHLNCALLAEALDYEELKGVPIRMSLNLVGEFSEPLLTKCIFHAAEFDFVSADSKLQVCIPVNGQTGDSTWNVLAKIPPEIRRAIELVAMVEPDDAPAVTRLAELGFDGMIIVHDEQIYTLVDRAIDAGLSVGIRQFEETLGDSPTMVRLDYLTSLREEVDGFYFNHLHPQDTNALTQ